jgi:hypothetical protein
LPGVSQAVGNRGSRPFGGDKVFDFVLALHESKRRNRKDNCGKQQQWSVHIFDSYRLKSANIKNFVY